MGQCFPPTLFSSHSQAFKKTSVRGENNWFTVPTGWFTQPNPLNTSELIASPNADFSRPIYYVVLDDSMQNFAFQDLWLEKLLNSGNTGRSGGSTFVPSKPVSYTFNGLAPLAPTVNLSMIDRATQTNYNIFVANGNIKIAAGGQAGLNGILLIDLYSGQVFQMYVSNGEITISNPVNGGGFYQAIPFIDTITSAARIVTLSNGNLTVT